MPLNKPGVAEEVFADVRQVETATAAGTITLAGNATAIVTAADVSGTPVTVTYAVALNDTATLWAAKARAAIAANAAITAEYEVSGATTSIVITRKVLGLHDSTLNIALADSTSTGITEAGTSVGTTTGLVNAAGVDAALTVAKDIVCTAPITVNGGASLNDVLPGADADVTFALTQNLPGINRFLRGSFNPQNRYAIDANICLMPLSAGALTITSIKVTCDADPVTEFDADLNWADAFIGKANAAKLADITTTAGAYSSGAVTLALAASKALYLTLADPDDNIKEVAYEITYDFD